MLIIPARRKHRNEAALKCQWVWSLTPRDVTLPHATVVPPISRTHEPPWTKGPLRAPASHLLPRCKGGRRESRFSGLEMFKLHRGGNQSTHDSRPAQHNSGTGQTLESRGQLWDVKEGVSGREHPEQGAFGGSFQKRQKADVSQKLTFQVY